MNCHEFLVHVCPFCFLLFGLKAAEEKPGAQEPALEARFTESEIFNHGKCESQISQKHHESGTARKKEASRAVRLKR